MAGYLTGVSIFSRHGCVLLCAPNLLSQVHPQQPRTSTVGLASRGALKAKNGVRLEVQLYTELREEEWCCCVYTWQTDGNSAAVLWQTRHRGYTNVAAKDLKKVQREAMVQAKTESLQ